jgi:hypothetical protein
MLKFKFFRLILKFIASFCARRHNNWDVINFTLLGFGFFYAILGVYSLRYAYLEGKDELFWQMNLITAVSIVFLAVISRFGNKIDFTQVLKSIGEKEEEIKTKIEKN